jgi:hypothetical protein
VKNGRGPLVVGSVPWMTLPKRAPVGQPSVKGQTGEPAFVDALAGGQVGERAEVFHIHLIGSGEIRHVEPLVESLVIRAVGAQRGSDRLARDEFPRLRRSGAEGRVPSAN